MSKRLYLETKLYNVNDRLASLELCERIDEWIRQNDFADLGPCFLPYRDSNGELEEHVEDEGQEIFRLDIQALRSCTGVVGYFDGVHYDSGCAFEVGCGYAWGYPIHLISTDFHKWSVGGSDRFYVASKLLEHLATLVYIPEGNASIADYRRQQEDLKEQAMQELRKNLKRSFGEKTVLKDALNALDVKYDYYLDPNFQYTESGRIILKEIISMIEKAGKTYITGDNQGDITADIDRLRESGHAIFFDDCFEPNVDSALMHGIAFGIGRPPIVYTSNLQRTEAGDRRDWLNIMIRYSADAIVENLEELNVTIQSHRNVNHNNLRIKRKEEKSDAYTT